MLYFLDLLHTQRSTSGPTGRYVDIICACFIILQQVVHLPCIIICRHLVHANVCKQLWIEYASRLSSERCMNTHAHAHL